MVLEVRHVLDAAENAGCLPQIQQSFRKDYLEMILQNNENSSATEVLKILVDSMRTYEILHGMEDKMCVTDFAKRICAGYWELSGHDREGRPMLWVRAGLVTAGFDNFASKRSLRPGTQKWYSALRSAIYVYELFLRNGHLRDILPPGYAICYDLRGQGALDGNLAFIRELSSVITRLFPSSSSDRLYFFGLNQTISLYCNAVQKICGGLFDREQCVIMTSPEHAANIIEHECDIPYWLLDFVPYTDKCVAANQIWGMDRFMGSGAATRVMHSDIFNPVRERDLKCRKWLPLNSGYPSKEHACAVAVDNALSFSIKPTKSEDLDAQQSKNSLPAIDEHENSEESNAFAFLDD